MAKGLKWDSAEAALVVVDDVANSDLTLTPKGDGQVVSAADIDVAGGYRQTIDLWYKDNVAASLTDSLLTRNSTPAFGDKWIALRDGSVTGICVKSNAARTAGTLTAKVYKNGVALSLTAVLDGTNTTFKNNTQLKDAETFVAGDELTVGVTTDSGWLPTTADIRVSIDIET